MLVKAIIEEKIDKYSYRVRVPLLNKLHSSANPTNTEDLSVAPICTTPGVEIVYNVGDIVFISFENNDYNHPVIIGNLFRDGISGSYNSINTTNLNVSLSTSLSNDTKIGDISSNQVYSSLSSLDVVNSLIDNLTNSSLWKYNPTTNSVDLIFPQ